jgi:hypothetical protein
MLYMFIYQILKGSVLFPKTGLLDDMQNLQEDQLDGPAVAVSHLGVSNAWGS